MRRVMLKLSGEALAGENGSGFDFKTLDSICKQIKKVKSKNLQIAIVTGGGNFIRGKMLSEIDKYKADEIGMLSTYMNSLYIQGVLRVNGIDSEIFGAFPMSDIAETFSKYKAIDAMNNGKVVILAGGTGHPYFTTDTGVVLRSIELECTELLLAKSIDYVYDKDPVKYSDAKKYKKITMQELFDKKLEVIDLSATVLCLTNKLNLRIFSLNIKNSIFKAIKGEDIGTLVYN
ncbi:MAG: UMP kinase [Lachnospiraceae bacterium]|nr:UMP kinase [Lachnospiraceae bacterium]